MTTFPADPILAGCLPNPAPPVAIEPCNFTDVPLPPCSGMNVFTYVQAEAVQQWNVFHNKGAWPVAVTCFNEGGGQIEGTILNLSLSSVAIIHRAASSGVAYLIFAT